MSIYRLTVEFKRDLEDDLEVTKSADPLKLVKLLAAELQEAYDKHAISGHFQVTSITLNNETTLIEVPDWFKVN